MFLFIIFALIAILAGFGVIFSRKPVYSALFLFLNFSALAALYILLQAQYLAMVQVIVYAGAIVVLFLFVVMLIGGGELRDLGSRNGSWRQVLTWPRAAALVLSLLLVGALIYGSVVGALSPVAGAGEVFGQGSVEAVGGVLYTTYLLPFELTSVLLLVGMIGAVVLARKSEE